MKKTVLCAFVLSCASMANSACLTSACAANERASFACVHSNNLRKVSVLNNGEGASLCSSAPSCCTACKDTKGTTHYSTPGNDIAWDGLNSISGLADSASENCAYMNHCDTICPSCCD